MSIPRYFSDEPALSPFLEALNEVRHLATRGGWCWQHVQAITVAINEYAEAATGNREYFLNSRTQLVVVGRLETFRRAT